MGEAAHRPWKPNEDPLTQDAFLRSGDRSTHLMRSTEPFSARKGHLTHSVTVTKLPDQRPCRRIRQTGRYGASNSDVPAASPVTGPCPCRSASAHLVG